VQQIEPQCFVFADDGRVPNNPLPFLIYQSVVRLDGADDPAAAIENLFHGHGWGDSWRNGIFPYLHYHSAIHEVLGIATGTARVRFGGDAGVELELAPGDVAVLPAGTGHQRLSGSRDLLVVGAYPPDGKYDLCRGTPSEHARAKASIPRVPLPPSDPVFGREGPLMRLWQRAR
jgi:uncharacterized protein YjlB